MGCSGECYSGCNVLGMNKITAATIGLTFGLAIAAGAVAVTISIIPEPATPDTTCLEAARDLDALLEDTAYDLIVPTSTNIYAGELVDPDWFVRTLASLAERQQTIDMTTLKACLGGDD